MMAVADVVVSKFAVVIRMIVHAVAVGETKVKTVSMPIQIKVHLWRLFRRLGVKSRTQAIHTARTNGLIQG